MSLILFFHCGCLMINVFLLSKFFLSHESRSIAILDHFQSWKSLQRTGWKKEGNKSSFIHSLPPLRSARQASRLITISIIAFLPFPLCSILHFSKQKIQFHFMFRILNVMCGGYCHLMNVLSAGLSSLILIHFRGSMPLWLGQKNAFNIEIV